ncbi:flagellar assembly protein FliX [Pseudoblastomonas halimionae]|uniref:Flagellar trans-acting factor FliX n=1 Tax=Alteriqipengyuania halimionae TaxID=1926630 RepID=A0A6I4U6D1_9SPHN|nr:flagellar assembly protein FliX [Alteriqipengyuania halimionae]MXP10445.1 flagellar trans-acting factor FliX [Alteriqipengyuania halimionae]
MRIGTLLPAPAILAAITRKPALLGAGEGQAAAGESAPPAPVQPTPPLGSVQMLVTLAAYDPDKERRRKMAEQGAEGLDELEALQVELATGGATPDRLEELAEWVAQLEQPTDPVLASIVADIELRVRVELAKFDIEV